MARQMNFFKKPETYFGGTVGLGKRKTARVLDSRKPIHFVLKTHKSTQLNLHGRQLRQLLFRFAKKFGVKVYSASVQNDHWGQRAPSALVYERSSFRAPWHICIKITNRVLYRSFI